MQELVREPWMDSVRPEEMTEEQALAYAQFQKKVKTILAEQETRKKLLHTELGKVSNRGWQESRL